MKLNPFVQWLALDCVAVLHELIVSQCQARWADL